MTITDDNRSEILYFAYGSNLSTKQMLDRCPDSTPIGIGHLPGWAWIINERGYANIVRLETLKDGRANGNPGSVDGASTLSPREQAQGKQPQPPLDRPPAVSKAIGVYGLLYLLPPADEDSLDRCEKVPWAYGKQTLNVEWQRSATGEELGRPQTVQALVYVDVERTRGSRPKDEYVHRMHRGIDECVEDWGLDNFYADAMRRWLE